MNQLPSNPETHFVVVYRVKVIYKCIVTIMYGKNNTHYCICYFLMSTFTEF